jgi:hypothetical protein
MWTMSSSVVSIDFLAVFLEVVASVGLASGE